MNSGRTRILVTGASYGLGATIAEQIAGRGDAVTSISRTAPGGRDIGWTQGDLGDRESIAGAVASLAESDSAPFDGMVFNAALADKTQTQWTPEQVERHFRINALGPFALWDELTKADLIASVCNVVLMGSFLQNGNVRQPAYAMSKAALWSWMRSFTMSQDGAHGVSMNMVWPGRVITPANPLRDIPEGDPNQFYTPERVAETVLNFLYQAPGGPRGTVVDLGRS